LDAKLPDQVVLGLEPGFFATAARVVTNDGVLLDGETLYLSIACMRLLTSQEFSAVLGHELNHFVGRDAEYSLRFLPVYQGLSAALLAAHGQGGWRGMALFSARAILVGSMGRFVRAERRIGRARELAADAAAARVAGGQAVFDAVMRMTATDKLWPATVQRTIDDIEAGRPLGNASRDHAERAMEALAALDEDVLVGGIEGARKSRLADTHPTLAKRAQSLGVSVRSARVMPEASEESAFSLLQDGESVEGLLTSVLREKLIASGMARVPTDPDRPNFVQKKRLQRQAQAAARQRRLEEERRAAV
jgi:Zn-dependent protease with chaperone function